ncbi:hypothetical protein TcCL_NonESM09104 [Trypanosoma cruzi]|nr:hypothetical protein TcCL_NonESM09104 [Trypanosoma cruzi]
MQFRSQRQEQGFAWRPVDGSNSVSFVAIALAKALSANDFKANHPKNIGKILSFDANISLKKLFYSATLGRRSNVRFSRQADIAALKRVTLPAYISRTTFTGLWDGSSEHHGDSPPREKYSFTATSLIDCNAKSTAPQRPLNASSSRT